MNIASVDAIQVFDSRGNPTVEATVTLAGGARGRGLVPSGASTGRYEALELRDSDPERFLGRSVLKVVDHIRNQIAPKLAGRDAEDQAGIDRTLIELDGTSHKSRLGANALLAVSMAVASAAARSRGEPLYRYLGGGQGTLLPLPEVQIFGGGRHAKDRVDVQDFMIIPVGATSYQEALEMAFKVFHAAGEVLDSGQKRAGVADEGGYWPVFSSNEEALETLVVAIRQAGLRPGTDAAIALDIAASNLYRGDGYRFGLERRNFSSEAFADLLVSWLSRYPIVSIEDPLSEDDWDGWSRLHKRLGGRVQLVGDDLFVTDVEQIRKGIRLGVANAVLIKPNQIGTVSETLEAVKLAQAAGWRPIISARSGETEDTFIAHLAVAVNAGQLKVGSFCRSERMCKWNEVLRIERELGTQARYEGARALGITR